MNLENHVLLLTPGFPKDENDFLCIPPIQDFLLKYKEIYPQTKFTVIAFQYPIEKRNYNWNGINVYALGGNDSAVRKLYIWKEAIKTSQRIHKGFPFSSIHSLWFGECALVGNHLSKSFGCNHICTLMGQDVRSSNYYLRFLDKDKIKFISLSQNQTNELSRITNRKVDAEIFWGVDEQIFNTNDIRKIDLLAVGSLIPLKNYSLFIKVIAEVVKRFQEVVCKLIGDGPELTMLKDMTAKYKINKNIEFTGILSRRDIFKLMQQSKIFVHSSSFEGSGYVFAEALANGMNIVSFNVGYAQQHPKWFIAKDEEEFLKITERLLSTELEFNPVNIFPLTETINKYASIYGID